MTDYGKYLGTAFQIIDDVMDYCSQSEEMGKNVGDDLAEGKPTLPLLRAMEVGTPEERQLARDAIEHRNGWITWSAFLGILGSHRSLEYPASELGKRLTRPSPPLAILPDSRHKQALETLAIWRCSAAPDASWRDKKRGPWPLFIVRIPVPLSYQHRF